MTSSGTPAPPPGEAWLRGPLEGYEPLLMPVAHALVQAREDIERLVRTVREEDVWTRPGGAASIGFHILHAGGSVDCLCTYARGERLDEEQLRALGGESEASGDALPEVAANTIAILERALTQVRATPRDTLLEPRTVGRAALPSTVIGLFVHIAEHTTRHVGQATTTAAIMRGLGQRSV